MGNRISTVLVDLPTDEPDPVARLTHDQRRPCASSRTRPPCARARSSSAPTGWAPPLVSSMLARAMGGMRAFNLVVSNVPGPQQPF